MIDDDCDVTTMQRSVIISIASDNSHQSEYRHNPVMQRLSNDRESHSSDADVYEDVNADNKVSLYRNVFYEQTARSSKLNTSLSFVASRLFL